MKNINQYRLGTGLRVRLADTAVYYCLTENGREREVAIPYENIIGSKVRWDEDKPWTRKVGAFLLTLGIVQLGYQLLAGGGAVYLPGVSLLAGACFLLAFRLTRAAYWKLDCQGETEIKLFRSIPDETSVDAFIGQLLDKRNAYLRSLYGQVNARLDYQGQYVNFDRLRSYGVFDEEEYREKVAELNRVFQVEERRIGFFTQ